MQSEGDKDQINSVQEKTGVLQHLDPEYLARGNELPTYKYFSQSADSPAVKLAQLINERNFKDEEMAIPIAGVYFKDGTVVYSADMPSHEDLVLNEQKPSEEVLAYFKVLGNSKKAQDFEIDIYCSDQIEARKLTDFLLTADVPAKAKLSVTILNNLLGNYDEARIVYEGDIEAYRKLEAQRKRIKKKITPGQVL